MSSVTKIRISVGDIAATAPAKITAPKLSGIHERPRLYRLLDTARERPIVWISAPPGSGKTALVASYLQKCDVQPLWYNIDKGDSDISSLFHYVEWAAKLLLQRQEDQLQQLGGNQLEGNPAFTSNFFRHLFAAIPRPSVIVLDDYQQLNVSAVTQEVIQQGLSEIPAGINVIVLSREEPPSAYARLRASGRIALFAGDEIKLTENETASIVRLHRKSVAKGTDITQELYKQTQGWVAGLMLFIEQINNSEPQATNLNKQPIYDYFSNELFRQIDPTTKDFLLKTAFLPKISISAACELTGRSDNEMILADLARRNYFCVRHAGGTYEYHPLFRAFLMERANLTYERDTQLWQLKKSTARLLAESGEIEAAVDFLQREQYWSEALQLAIQHAWLYVAQGRTTTLAKLLQRGPQVLLTNDPWVLYLQGLCQAAISPASARAYFEQAFSLFELQGNSSPLYLTWTGIMESYLLEWNDFTDMRKWLNIYPTLAQGRAPPDPTVETASVFTYLTGLRLGWTDHPDFIPSAERAEAIFRKETDPRLRLSQALALIGHYGWRGEIARMTDLIETLEPLTDRLKIPPIEKLIWHLYRAIHSHLSGAPEESMRAIKDGLTLAETSGIHVFDAQLISYGIPGQLMIGQFDNARALLQRMTPYREAGQSGDISYRILAALTLLHEGNASRALDESNRALQMSQANNFSLGTLSSTLCVASALARVNRTEEALNAIAEAHSISVSTHSKLFTCYTLHIEANIHRLRGEEKLSLRALRESLTLAHEMNIGIPFWCTREDTAILYAMALNTGIQSLYVRSIILKTGLSPPHGMLPEGWPWQLRVYTLGRFLVMKDNVPLSFSCKAQHKPLELLRGLISFGGRDVSSAMLAQALWPDSDGDLAKTALETTLHRLRRLLGDKSIVMHDGQLSLNPEYCWLDTWAFERLTDQLESSTLTTVRTQPLLDLYQGAFLHSDDASWVLTQRDRLRSRFLRAVVYYGSRLEADSQFQAALPWYQQGIEADPLAEELYLRLMHCYKQLNRPAEALAVYQRCQRVLSSALAIEPAADTRLLHDEIERSLIRNQKSTVIPERSSSKH